MVHFNGQLTIDSWQGFVRERGTTMERGRMVCCRAACPQAAVNIRQQFDRRGGMSPKGTSVGRGHPALREDRGYGVRVDVGIDPYNR